MDKKRAWLVIPAVLLAALLVPSEVNAYRIYWPRYRYVEQAGIIVVGRLVRIVDPAAEEFKKPLSV